MPIPDFILAQVHHLAADGRTVEQIATMLRLRDSDVQAELDSRAHATPTGDHPDAEQEPEPSGE
jgi:hypothetical protein